MTIKTRLKRDGLGSMAKRIFVGEIMGDFGFKFFLKMFFNLFTIKGNFYRNLFFKIFLSPKKPLRLGQRNSLVGCGSSGQG